MTTPAPKPDLRLAEFLPYRLSFTSNRVSERIARVYAALFGLSIPEWRLVAVIAEQGATTQQAIGALTGMDKVTVSRAAIALVDRGLVARRPNPDDRRSHLLSLSGAGRDLYATVAPKALEMEAEIFSCLTADERRTLAGFLARIDAATAES
jgi:DNA-binding MarR family transcriptional regulator